MDKNYLLRAGRGEGGRGGGLDSHTQADNAQETASTLSLGCPVPRAGIQPSAAADLLSIAIGCLPRRMR